MKTRLYHSALAISLASALAACSSTQPLPQNSVAFTLQATTPSALTISSSTSTPITFQVSAPSGTSAAGLTLNASTDARYCSLDQASATTDANGTATFNLISGPVGGVNCATSVTLLNVITSRGNATLNTFIRPLQRVLQTPPTVALPSVSVNITDAGPTTSTVTLAAPINLDAPDSAHSYGVYLAKTDVNGAVSGVTFVGRINSNTNFPMSFPGPINLASGGYNTVGLVLQGTAGVTNLGGNALLGNFTPAAGGSSNTDSG
jgi:hypothetical protein